MLAIVKDPVLKNYLRQVENEFFVPFEFRDSLLDYESLRQKKYVGLIVIDYEQIRYLSEEERSHFYRIDCPRIMLTKINGRHYALPVSRAFPLNRQDNFARQDLVKIMQEYFRPLPAISSPHSQEIPFVTRNVKMQQMLAIAKRIAQYDTHVLILGESGTGKDLLARILHRFSKRHERPMIKVNCAAIPANLLETEMFGYKKGAFTDAFEDKPGKIQMANGSTLFLDEIGDMDLHLQAKLLRVVEVGEADVIGANEPTRVNIRLISATNQNLARLVEEGRFRADLYYRLNVVNFKIPPLRERPEDIPALMEHFLAVFNEKYKKNVQGMEPAALKEILNYHWPGNVREFAHFMERLVSQAAEEVLPLEMIRRELQSQVGNAPPDGADRSLARFLENQERQFIIKSLINTDLRIGETAKILKISRASLFRKMRKYHIDVGALKKGNTKP